jgi:hypothetical protein
MRAGVPEQAAMGIASEQDLRAAAGRLADSVAQQDPTPRVTPLARRAERFSAEGSDGTRTLTSEGEASSLARA